jgi:hypothetical protein
MRFRLLYSYNTTPSRKFSFILVAHYEQRHDERSSQQVEPDRPAEYKGRTAYVNENLSLVRKAEQLRKAYGLPRANERGTQQFPARFRARDRGLRRNAATPLHLNLGFQPL